MMAFLGLRQIFILICAFSSFAPPIFAEIIRFHNKPTVYLASTVYASGDVIGQLPANITITMDRTFTGQASYIIFNILDTEIVRIPHRGIPKGIICDEDLAAFGFCKESEIGQVIHQSNRDKYRTGVIDPLGRDVETERSVVYPVAESGFYMVYVHATRGKMGLSGHIQFNNPFGYLPAIKYPQMIAVLVFAILYLFIALAWAYFLFRYKDEILSIQKHISALIFILCVEYLMTFALLNYANNYGDYNFYLRWLVFLVNAIKFTSMLFLLLAVSKGYGIVVPRLGTTLYKMYGLAGAHFVASIISLSESLSPIQTTEDDVLLYNLPVTFTTGFFLIWILRSLRQTIQILTARKQNNKLQLYQKLTRIITISILMAFLISIFVIYDLLSHRTDPIWLGTNWPHFWFLVDGWPMFLFFFSFIALLFFVRPRADNRRYGLEELPTTDLGILEVGTGGSMGIGGVFSSPGTQHHVPLHDMANRKAFEQSRSYSSSFSTPASSKGNLPSYSSSTLHRGGIFPVASSMPSDYQHPSSLIETATVFTQPTLPDILDVPEDPAFEANYEVPQQEQPQLKRKDADEVQMSGHAGSSPQRSFHEKSSPHIDDGPPRPASVHYDSEPSNDDNQNVWNV